jgi:hypothetical protein
MVLVHIKLSEISQAQKDQHFLLSVVCGNYDADLEEETRVSNVYKKLGYM